MLTFNLTGERCNIAEQRGTPWGTRNNSHYEATAATVGGARLHASCHTP